MAESDYVLHGGFHEDEAREIVEQHRHFLLDKNIVCIDVGMKTVKGSETQRPAFIVHVINKMSPEEIGTDSQQLSADSQQLSQALSPDSSLTTVVPRTLKIRCSKVTSTVPTKLGSVMTDDGSHSFELETDVMETGVIKAEAPAEGGYPVFTDWDHEYPGTLGVNIVYEEEYRLLSNAHVLTGYDEIKTDVYSPAYGPSNKLFPVTGQKPVKYYKVDNPPDPVSNTQDVAWAKITDPNKVSKTIRILNVAPKGIRPIKESDTQFKYVGINAKDKAATCTLKSFVAEYKSSEDNSSDETVYTFWKNGIKYQRSFGGSGDSGSALISGDNYVIGLHRAGAGNIGFGCRL